MCKDEIGNALKNEKKLLQFISATGSRKLKIKLKDQYGQYRNKPKGLKDSSEALV